MYSIPMPTVGFHWESLLLSKYLRVQNFVLLQELIQYLKYTCPAHLYGTSISPPAAQQILSAIKVLLGEDGSSRGLPFVSLFVFYGSYFLHLCTSKLLFCYVSDCQLCLSQVLKSLQEYVRTVTSSDLNCRRWVLRSLGIMIPR